MKRFAKTMATMLGLAAGAFWGGGVSFAEESPRPEIVLYDGTGLTGPPQPMFKGEANLGAKRFNNRASSLDIRAGVWEICTDRNFSGRCEILTDGVSDLTAMGLNNNISSARPVQGSETMDLDDPVILHSKTRFRGKAHSFAKNHGALALLGFDDKADSITVNSGVWELCEDEGFRGRCAYVSQSVSRLKSIGLSGRVSSIRRVSGLKSPKEYSVVLYPETNFRGAYRGLDNAQKNLARIDFSNRTQSIQVNEGRWVICDNSDFRGRCEVIGQSMTNLADLKLARTISSIRPHVDDAATAGLKGGQGDAPLNGFGGLSFPGEAAVFFPTPSIKGVRIDECVHGRERSCGLEAAEQFCKSGGFSGVTYFAVRRGVSETVSVSGKPLCSGSACRALSDIVCLK